MARLRRRLVIDIRSPAHTDHPWLAELLKDGPSRLSKRNEQYLPFMATLLDVLAEAEWSISAAARRLGITTARLSHFLKIDTDIWREVNRRRTALGLRPLQIRD